MTSKLLPCPFCGSPAHELQWEEGGSMDRFCCSNFVGDCHASSLELEKEEWNKRAPIVEADGMGEAVACQPHNLIYCDICAWNDAERNIQPRNVKPVNLGAGMCRIPKVSGAINTSDSRLMESPVAGRICVHPENCTSCSWCGFKASQPAPISVVLPSYDGSGTDQHFKVGNDPDDFQDGYAQGWNACLDKVKELNQ